MARDAEIGARKYQNFKIHFKNNAAATSGSHGGKILKFYFKSSIASANGLYESKILKFTSHVRATVGKRP